MYIPVANLALAALVMGFGLGVVLTVLALRGWIKQEVTTETRRIFDGVVGYARDVVRTQQATTPPPPSTIQEIAMTFGKLRSEMEDAAERLAHVERGGNWDDTPAQRAVYAKNGNGRSKA